MEIIVRALTDQDKEAALRVEAGAMPDNKYLNEVWPLFTAGSDGDLLGAFVANSLAGIGKITRLYGDYGWLETLRVHPDRQRKGLGRAIWAGFFREIERMKIKSVGMYTEAENVVSKGLAEQFGLSLSGFYREFRLALGGPDAAEQPAPQAGPGAASASVISQQLQPGGGFFNDHSTFEPVPIAEGERALSGHYKKMPPHLVVNRTFYPAAEGLGRHLAQAGWLYRSREGDLLVAGNRFHADRLLHVPYFSGRREPALAFATRLAVENGAPALSCLCPITRPGSSPVGAEGGSTVIELLQNSGFTPGSAFMTLWRDL